MTRPFVLIVDDDEVIRSLLRLTLPTEGFDVLEAKDGQDALGLADGNAPALVVLDWRMPGLSGEQVLTELKATSSGDADHRSDCGARVDKPQAG